MDCWSSKKFPLTLHIWVKPDTEAEGDLKPRSLSMGVGVGVWAGGGGKFGLGQGGNRRADACDRVWDEEGMRLDT